MGATRTKPRSSVRNAPYGPNIVRAWFDTVFRYALRGLESERGFLAKHNWTFRFHTLTLEYLGPLAEHLPAEARENLEQFVSFFPKVEAEISHQDACEHQLEQDCRSYFAAILQSVAFQEVFESVAEESPRVLGREFSSFFGAYTSPADFKGCLAEYLINNVECLASCYSTAELWNRYRDRFLPVVDGPDLSHLRVAVERAGHSMLGAVDELTSLLKETRSELSLRFDVAYVAEIKDAR